MRFEEMDGAATHNYLNLYYELIKNENKEVIVFAGSGICGGLGASSWSNLLEGLCDYIKDIVIDDAGLKSALEKEPDFLKKGQIIKDSITDDVMFQDAVKTITQKEKRDIKKSDAVYWIPQISKFCITTNYDNILEQAFCKNGMECKTISVNDVSENTQTEMRNHSSQDLGLIFKIHGDANDAGGCVILAYEDYIMKYGNLEQPDISKPLVNTLRSIASQHCILFVGISLEEEVIAKAMSILFNGEDQNTTNVPLRYAVLARPLATDQLGPQVNKENQCRLKRYGAKGVFYKKSEESDYSGAVTILRQLARDCEEYYWNIYREICKKETFDNFQENNKISTCIRNFKENYECIELDEQGIDDEEDIVAFYRNAIVKSACLDGTFDKNISSSPIEWNFFEGAFDLFADKVNKDASSDELENYMEGHEILPIGNSIYYLYSYGDERKESEQREKLWTLFTGILKQSAKEDIRVIVFRLKLKNWSEYSYSLQMRTMEIITFKKNNLKKDLINKAFKICGKEKTCRRERLQEVEKDTSDFTISESIRQVSAEEKGENQMIDPAVEREQDYEKIKRKTLSDRKKQLYTI